MSQPHPRIIWGFHYLNPDIFHSLSTLSTSIMSQPTRLTYFTLFFSICSLFWWVNHQPHQPSFLLAFNKTTKISPWTPRRALERSGRHCRDKHPAKARGSVGQFTLAGFRTHGCWLWRFKWMFIPQKSIVFWCGLKKSSTCLEWLQHITTCWEMFGMKNRYHTTWSLEEPMARHKI